MTIAFISDLHLSAARPSSISLFCDFMEVSATQLSKLYILGDLFDYWIGDDGAEVLGFSLAEQALKQTSDSGTEIFFIAGNRDFLVGDAFTERTGVEILKDKTVLELYGQRVMITHGDQFCIDDIAYMKAREHFLNPQWQQSILKTPIEDRIKEAMKLRSESEQIKSGKSEEIMDVNPQEIIRVFEEYDLDVMIHGHTHRPYVHQLEANGKTCRRYVLGEWKTERSVIYANQGKYYLKK
jgi:UDP-2,3-diacylglucosamine hydrolase